MLKRLKVLQSAQKIRVVVDEASLAKSALGNGQRVPNWHWSLGLSPVLKLQALHCSTVLALKEVKGLEAVKLLAAD